jgi:hypothetical protein
MPPPITVVMMLPVIVVFRTGGGNGVPFPAPITQSCGAPPVERAPPASVAVRPAAGTLTPFFYVGGGWLISGNVLARRFSFVHRCRWLIAHNVSRH